MHENFSQIKFHILLHTKIYHTYFVNKLQETKKETKVTMAQSKQTVRLSVNTRSMSLVSPLPTRTAGIPPPVEGVEGNKKEILSDEEDGNIEGGNSNTEDDEEISNKEVESENDKSSNNDEVIKNEDQQKVNDDSYNKKSILNGTNTYKREKNEEDNVDLGQKLVTLDDPAETIRNTMHKFIYCFSLKKTSF